MIAAILFGIGLTAVVCVLAFACMAWIDYWADNAFMCFLPIVAFSIGLLSFLFYMNQGV